MVLIIVENVYKFKAQFKFAKRYFMCRSKTPDKKKDIFANSLKRKMWFLYNSMGEGEAWTIQNIVLMNAATESRMKLATLIGIRALNGVKYIGGGAGMFCGNGMAQTILTTLKPYMSFLKTLWQCHCVGGGSFYFKTLVLTRNAFLKLLSPLWVWGGWCSPSMFLKQCVIAICFLHSTVCSCHWSQCIFA